MKFVFLGTPDFAHIALEELIKRDFVPQLVVCNPDRPVGRKKIITAPPVKILAEEHGIPVFQPDTVDVDVWKEKMREAEFAIVAAYTKILPQEALNIFPKGIIGIHPSLLPKYRGATPIQSAILAGEKETGVTLFLTDEKMDHGQILAQEIYAINNEHYKDLERKLALLGAELAVKTIPMWLKGDITPTEQDHDEATFTKKISTEDAYIEPEELKQAETIGGETAERIERKIRAFDPEPGAWTMRDGKRLKLHDAVMKDGKLKLTAIQWEGNKRELI